MQKDLDEKLCKDFPALYQNRNKPSSESCMHWGFSCNDGWEPLIRQLSNFAQHCVNRARDEKATKYREDCGLPWNSEITEAQNKELELDAIKVTVEQVKEKYGGLRWYWDSENLPEKYYWMISGAEDLAEEMSFLICEDCGNPGVLRGPGYYRTTCELHAKGSIPMTEYNAWHSRWRESHPGEKVSAAAYNEYLKQRSSTSAV